jgi:hypothetical protein
MKCSERPDFAVLLVGPSAHGTRLDCVENVVGIRPGVAVEKIGCIQVVLGVEFGDDHRTLAAMAVAGRYPLLTFPGPLSRIVVRSGVLMRGASACSCGCGCYCECGCGRGCSCG